MTITRANVEGILVKRCGALMTAAGLDGTTVDGTNTDLNDPIGAALRRLDYSVASVAAVANADLDDVEDADIDALLDLAELRTLESILGNLDDVDIKLGPRAENLSQLASMLEKRVDRLQKRIQDEHGLGLGTLEAGVITLDFADHNEDLPGEE